MQVFASLAFGVGCELDAGHAPSAEKLEPGNDRFSLPRKAYRGSI